MSARRPAGDRGIGLAELVVAIAVSSVLLLVVGTTFTGSLRGASHATTRVAQTAELRLAMDTMARRLRLAVAPRSAPGAFELAQPRAVTFYASLVRPGDTAAQPPTLVAYDVSGGCLRETRTRPVTTSTGALSWSDPAAVSMTTCLARGAVNASGGPLFTYFGTGAVGAPALGDPVAGVAAADLQSIGSVEVTASVRPAAGTSPVTRASTRVTLVNLLGNP